MLRCMVSSLFWGLAVFAVVGAVFPAIPLVVSRLIRPFAPNPAKSSNYECGMEPIGAGKFIHFQYFEYVAMFLIFDIVAIYFFLWALNPQSLSGLPSVHIFLFAFVILGGLLFSLWEAKE